jgi:hypothetical protein
LLKKGIYELICHLAPLPPGVKGGRARVFLEKDGVFAFRCAGGIPNSVRSCETEKLGAHTQKKEFMHVFVFHIRQVLRRPIGARGSIDIRVGACGFVFRELMES